MSGHAIKPVEPPKQFDINAIQRMIPHRPPMLLVDRVENVVLDDSCVGIKSVTMNEPFFPGHFPGEPVMPGVLIVESMAQTAAVLVVATLGAAAEGKLVYFMSIDDCRFRRPVVPGDRLEMHIRKVAKKMSVWKFSGEAKVDGKVVAQGVFAAKISDN